MTETQHRFLREIAARVPAAHVVELRLFPSLKHGRTESGVAVLAVEAPALAPASEHAPATAAPSGDAAETTTDADGEVAALSVPPIETPESELLAAESANGELPSTEIHVAEPPLQPPAPVASEPPPRHQAADRLSILTARYRLTLKGPDRGKWEFSVVHDADAPLAAVDQVVRGVARRVGDAGEPELLSGTELQRAVDEPWWTAAT